MAVARRSPGGTGTPLEAARSLQRALELRPDNAAGWIVLGLRWHALADFGAALEAFDRALALDPCNATAWNDRALTLHALGRHAEALHDFDRALQANAKATTPDQAAIWLNRAKVLNDVGRAADALASLDRGLALTPDVAAGWSSRAAPLRALGRLPEALQACDRALALDPALASAWAQRGACLTELGRPAQAEASLGRALTLAPGDIQARFNLSLLHLTLGRFESGWDAYESRTGVQETLQRHGAPVWDGTQPLAGKTIVLHCEQGLGDTIQFCRFARVLADRDARVVLTVPAVLQRLIEGVDDRVLVLTDGDTLPPADYQCLLLSLPHRLGVRLETIPAQIPYVRAPEDRCRHWRGRVGLDDGRGLPARRRLGLVISGSAGHGNDCYRSLPLERLMPLLHQLQRDGWECHLLQKELRASDEALLGASGVADHRAALTDFCETAALVSCMDAVLSVDTSVAHLAGAMGKQLLLLLPANPDWRWMLDRPDSPWYPGARLFRQTTLGQWVQALEQLRLALDQWPIASEPSRPVQRQSGDTPIAASPDLSALLAGAAALHQSGDHRAAIAGYRSVLAYDATAFDAHRLLGAAFYQLGEPASALAPLQAAAALQADNAEVRAVLGAVQWQLGNRADALQNMDAALAREPARAELWTNRAKLLFELGRGAEALDNQQRALAIEPAHPRMRFERGLLRLALGELESGWADFECRLQLPDLAPPRLEAVPVWDGRAPLAGRTLLLHFEQGLGDTIQFCRYIPLLAAQGAKVLLTAQQPLCGLLQTVPGAPQVLAVGARLPPVDYQCGLLSLPHHLGTALATIPAALPYLQPDPRCLSRWRRKIVAQRAGAGATGIRIGLVCSGNALHVNDRQRSIALRQFSALADLGCQWHLLQKELRDDDVPWLHRLGIVDHRADLHDLGETAALARCMDAVVSVDTAVAHLAGALGVPLFVLLPANPDWRWMLERDDSPWYPGARLLRQRQLGEWDEPLRRLRGELAERLPRLTPAAADECDPRCDGHGMKERVIRR